jgi:hypothetical protein
MRWIVRESKLMQRNHNLYGLATPAVSEVGCSYKVVGLESNKDKIIIHTESKDEAYNLEKILNKSLVILV